MAPAGQNAPGNNVQSARFAVGASIARPQMLRFQTWKRQTHSVACTPVSWNASVHPGGRAMLSPTYFTVDFCISGTLRGSKHAAAFDIPYAAGIPKGSRSFWPSVERESRGKTHSEGFSLWPLSSRYFFGGPKKYRRRRPLSL